MPRSSNGQDTALSRRRSGFDSLSGREDTRSVKEILDDATAYVREQTGRDDIEVVLDTRPLIVKPADRVWPDDFRGFGTNVKPRKQR